MGVGHPLGIYFPLTIALSVGTASPTGPDRSVVKRGRFVVELDDFTVSKEVT